MHSALVSKLPSSLRTSAPTPTNTSSSHPVPCLSEPPEVIPASRGPRASHGLPAVPDLVATQTGRPHTPGNTGRLLSSGPPRTPAALLAPPQPPSGRCWSKSHAASMETSPGTVFPDTQPWLGGKQNAQRGKGAIAVPRLVLCCWWGRRAAALTRCLRGRASWGRPWSPPGWGSSPPHVLRSAPCSATRHHPPPRCLPHSLQTHSHPTPLSSGSLLLHPQNWSRITAACLDLPGDTASSFQTVLVFTQPYWPRHCDPSSLSHHLLLVHHKHPH